MKIIRLNKSHEEARATLVNAGLKVEFVYALETYRNQSVQTTTCFILKDEVKIASGKSKTHPKDQYNKRKGKSVAFVKALGDLKEKDMSTANFIMQNRPVKLVF